jgi:hypothetical protein
MAERIVHYSDLSGAPGEGEGGLIPLVVDYPDVEERKLIEVTPDEMEKIGKAALAATVQLETVPDGEEKPSRFFLSAREFGKLVVGRTVEEVIADAKPAAPAKRRPNGNGDAERRSHNKTVTGEPLINYNEPENAGMPHNGRIGKKEGEFVRANLELVNQRRVADGHPAIDPAKPEDAKRYGFSSGESA